MGKPITKLEIRGFRGSTTAFGLEVDPQRKLTMLFGENGSGKSTILDAIDVVCNGGIGSLEDISAGQGVSKYLCSLGSPQATVRVTLQSNAESWTATMHGNALTVTPFTGKPRVRTLRRSKILDLVLAQPKERYTALRRFIEIGIVEKSEAALKQQLRDVGSKLNEQIARKQSVIDHLDNYWEAEHRPGPGQSAIAWVEAKVNAGIGNLSAHSEFLKRVVKSIDDVIEARNSLNAERSAESSLQGNLSGVEERIRNAPNVNTATIVSFIESLQKARSYVEAEGGLNRCPTCQRSIDRQQLLHIIDDQLSQQSPLVNLTEQLASTRRLLGVASTSATKARAKLVAVVRAAQPILSNDIPEVAGLNLRWPERASGEPEEPLLTSLADALAPVRESLARKRDSAERDVAQFNSLKQRYGEIEELKESILDLGRIRSGLERAFTIMHAKRIAFTQDILAGIALEANRLFQAVHPGENIGLDELEMEEAKQGSVSQTGLFHGHADIPPQAVFSESHLDTLGFCVWLALAKREQREETVLLIDDVFSSVDGVHLERIIDLLNAESPHFLQVIVATHYRLWWDRCQNAQGVQRIHLGQWSLTNGICAENMPLITQQLQQLADARMLDRQAVSSKAGILLEDVLDSLALLYARPLPRNKQNLYTLGDLLSACKPLFVKHNLTVNRNVSWNLPGQAEKDLPAREWVSP